MAELWTRPWALYARQHRHGLEPGDGAVPDGHRGPLWLYTRTGGPVRVDGRSDVTEPVTGFTVDDSRALGLLPLVLKRRPGVAIGAAGKLTRLVWNEAPEKLPSTIDPGTEEEIAARNLFQRAETVWDRLAEVETALADSITLWAELRRRWTEDHDEDEPRMDVIVRQSRRLGSILDALDRAPRRILRRTHRMVPVARVQEMDRRALTWLVRQPGETLAERAGDAQRILGSRARGEL